LTDVSVSLAMMGSPIAEDGGVATLTATLNDAISSDVTLDFGLTGTAVKDTNYTASDTKIVIPAGQTSGTLTLTSIDNDHWEIPNNTIIISTQKVVNAAVVNTSQFTVTVTDSFPEKNRAAGEAFLADNATKPDVVVRPSGLQYKVIADGPDSSLKPTSASTITIKYTGTLIDGTQFDSSNGQTRTFPLSNLIAGWKEALPLMSKGSHWMLYIPYNLGYGENASGDKIGPKSALIFDLELVDYTTP